MRRSAIIGVLVVLVIIWLVLIAYLAGPGASPAAGQAGSQPVRQPVDLGLQSANITIHPPVLNIEEINGFSEDFPFEGYNTSENAEIYYIQGTGVNGNGSAVSWMYGVRNASGFMLLIHDSSGWRMIPWRDTFSDQKIDRESLAGLDDIFRANQELLGSPSATDRKVEVFENRYSITVSEGTTTQIHTFDLGTGALIPAHEE